MGCVRGPGSPLIYAYLVWDETQLCYRANRDESTGFIAPRLLRSEAHLVERYVANVRRLSPRQRNEFEIWTQGRGMVEHSDVEVAHGPARLLPYRRELEHVWEATCELYQEMYGMN